MKCKNVLCNSNSDDDSCSVYLTTNDDSKSCKECYWYEGNYRHPSGNRDYCRKRDFAIAGITEGMCPQWIEIGEGSVLEKNW